LYTPLRTSHLPFAGYWTEASRYLLLFDLWAIARENDEWFDEAIDITGRRRESPDRALLRVEVVAKLEPLAFK